MFDLGSPSNLVRLRDALIERDLIYSEMRQLHLTDPVFGLWTLVQEEVPISYQFPLCNLTPTDFGVGFRYIMK